MAHELTKTPRLRGRRGVEQRKRRLAREPLCRDCLEQDGKVVPATQVDHIIPLSKGGPDTDENCRSLCDLHHRARTNEEFGRKRLEIGDDGWPIAR